MYEIVVWAWRDVDMLSWHFVLG